jgi:hypothetical protein
MRLNRRFGGGGLRALRGGFLAIAVADVAWRRLGVEDLAVLFLGAALLGFWDFSMDEEMKSAEESEGIVVLKFLMKSSLMP